MNQYIPVAAKITDIVKHTDIEWTFRVSCKTDGVLPGKFYEISIPKFGESPISVSGYGNDYIDFTIRNVGKVTSELFKYNIGDNFFIRGPYGNGFDVSLYEERDIVVVAGGSGLAPVRGIIEYFYNNPNKCKSFKLIAGFRSLEDILFKPDIKRWSEPFFSSDSFLSTLMERRPSLSSTSTWSFVTPGSSAETTYASPASSTSILKP